MLLTSLSPVSNLPPACLACHIQCHPPLNPCCSSCCFQMCLIRKDMKSVQDRLLSQMVSGHDTGDPSAWIRLKQLGSDFSIVAEPVYYIQHLETSSLTFLLPLFSYSKRARFRVWREACMLCFSPDGAKLRSLYCRQGCVSSSVMISFQSVCLKMLFSRLCFCSVCFKKMLSSVI